MPRSRVSLLSWVVAGAFILGSVLILVDRFNLFATPPDTEFPNLIDRLNGTAAYRQAIWPVFLWTNLLFAIGFAAAVAFAFSFAAAGRVAGGLPAFKSLAATGGIIAAIASVVPIGAVNASVWQLYCDCGFKDQELVAQFSAQMVTEDIGAWLGRFASVVLAVALVALTREAGALLSPSLRTWTYLTAIALVLIPFLGASEITRDPLQEELVSLATSIVLVPVWALWLGRTVDEAPAGVPAG